jgi:hypothetical protein
MHLKRHKCGSHAISYDTLYLHSQFVTAVTIIKVKGKWILQDRTANWDTYVIVCDQVSEQ